MYVFVCQWVCWNMVGTQLATITRFKCSSKSFCWCDSPGTWFFISPFLSYSSSQYCSLSKFIISFYIFRFTESFALWPFYTRTNILSICILNDLWLLQLSSRHHILAILLEIQLKSSLWMWYFVFGRTIVNKFHLNANGNNVKHIHQTYSYVRLFLNLGILEIRKSHFNVSHCFFRLHLYVHYFPLNKLS